MSGAKALRTTAQRYAAPDRPTLARCHRELQVMLVDENRRRWDLRLPPLDCPSRTELARELKRLDCFEVYAARHGYAAACRRFATGGGS